MIRSIHNSDRPAAAGSKAAAGVAAPTADARIRIHSRELDRTIEAARIIGRYGSGNGPVVVVTAGLHGNEPSGVFAAADVLQRLQQDGIDLQGRFIGLLGNTRALGAGLRQIDRDMNRIWSGAEISRLLEGNAEQAAQSSSEAREAMELHQVIMTILDEETGPFYFLDLHTTSSQSSPFVPFDDTLKNRDFARKFPVAGVLGIEEYLPGTLLSYLTRFNVVTLGYEAGQHVDPMSVDSHRALIWLALQQAGCLASDCGVDFPAEHRLLEQRAGDLTGFFDVRFRYGISEGEQFRMLPGFRNFAPVKKGQHLADNSSGPIRANFGGRILMPLYQSSGSDGFFLVRKIAPFWLTLSRWLRRGRYERWLALLPGVQWAADDPDTLIVDTRIARFLASEIFHLLGYRRSRVEGNKIRFSRREI